MGRKKKQSSISSRAKHDKAGLGQSEGHQGFELASMPLPWLESVASCLSLKWSRLRVFRTSKDMAALMLGHLGYTAGLSMDRVALQGHTRTRRQVHHHELMEQSVGFAAAHGKEVALSMVQGVTDPAHRVDLTAWSNVLTRASSLAGLEGQQLCAITSVSCGGTSKAPWVLQGSLIPDALVSLCPNLHTLHLWDAHIGSLPEPAAAGLAPCAKLECFEVEAFTFAHPISPAMMSYQASRFPALTSLTLSRDVTKQVDIDAMAGLVTTLASQLICLKLGSGYAQGSLPSFFPVGTVYSQLERLDYDLMFALVDTVESDSLPRMQQALPAITQLSGHRLDINGLGSVQLPWLQQLQSLSCGILVIDKLDEPEGASLVERLQACGGIHLRPNADGLLPLLFLGAPSALLVQLLPHIHCTHKSLYVLNFYELGSEELTAIGQHFSACRQIRFNAGPDAAAMRDLPQLMPNVEVFSLSNWEPVGFQPFLDMCDRATRPVEVRLFGEPNFQPIAERVAEMVREACPESKVSIGFEPKGG